ncbi:hypothetical protein [Undibacterium sp.]|uniref:hypothetical protein n=1 Tax=Undibacterium sp. TaxID=1914977 RepID=UPI003752E7B3
MRLISNEELLIVAGGNGSEVPAITAEELAESMEGLLVTGSAVLSGYEAPQVVEVIGHRLDFIDRLYATASVIFGDCITGGSAGGTLGAIGGQFVLPVLGAGPGAIAGGVIGCTLGVGAGLIADIFDLRQTQKP